MMTQQTLQTHPFSETIPLIKDRVKFIYDNTLRNAAVESDQVLCKMYEKIFCNSENRSITYHEVDTVKRAGRKWRQESKKKGSEYYGLYVRSLTKEQADMIAVDVCRRLWR